jgi:AraC-like DNA-binding protein
VLIGPSTFRRLVRARALLEDHALTVHEIAAQVGLSPSHFIRQFSVLYGTTPHQLRTRARLDRAKALLATGTPVTEVCMEVGFSSLGSFSALFTRWEGTSPSRHRSQGSAPGCLELLAQLPSNSREATGA